MVCLGCTVCSVVCPCQLFCSAVSRSYIYLFAIVICLVLLMCTLTILSSVLCVLMVEGLSVVVNVMLSLMSPPPALCNISVHTVVKLCTLGVFALG